MGNNFLKIKNFETKMASTIKMLLFLLQFIRISVSWVVTDFDVVSTKSSGGSVIDVYHNSGTGNSKRNGYIIFPTKSTDHNGGNSGGISGGNSGSKNRGNNGGNTGGKHGVNSGGINGGNSGVISGGNSGGINGGNNDNNNYNNDNSRRNPRDNSPQTDCESLNPNTINIEVIFLNCDVKPLSRDNKKIIEKRYKDVIEDTNVILKTDLKSKLEAQFKWIEKPEALSMNACPTNCDLGPFLNALELWYKANEGETDKFIKTIVSNCLSDSTNWVAPPSSNRATSNIKEFAKSSAPDNCRPESIILILDDIRRKKWFRMETFFFLQMERSSYTQMRNDLKTYGNYPQLYGEIKEAVCGELKDDLRDGGKSSCLAENDPDYTAVYILKMAGGVAALIVICSIPFV